MRMENIWQGGSVSQVMSNGGKTNKEHLIHCLFQRVGRGHYVKEVKSNSKSITEL